MKEFEQIYRKHMDAVFGFSVRCVGRREIAEEITGDVFLELYRNLDRIDETRLPTWLFTVAKNRATDYWRRLTLERQYASSAQDTATDPLPPYEKWLFENPALKPIHRVCLILRYVYGMDRAEIAQHTGLTENQIKGHLQYARRLLREELLRDSESEE